MLQNLPSRREGVSEALTITIFSFIWTFDVLSLCFMYAEDGRLLNGLMSPMLLEPFSSSLIDWRAGLSLSVSLIPRGESILGPSKTSGLPGGVNQEMNLSWALGKSLASAPCP